MSLLSLSVRTFMLVLLLSLGSNATAQTELRRPISPESPMWIIHIDTWNAPDPERIIEMVPEDIRPYVCFNLSLSATDATCCSGPNVCDSWMKACAAKRVWTMIQPASGSHSRFSDTEFSEYERYFKEYPNFIGWNFAEQFWGFGDPGQPTFEQRLNTFAHILDYCQQYGGYLVVSFTQAYFSAHMMPIAYMRNAAVSQRLKEHPENFICCEKYTMSTDFFDIESNCLGAYVGGYAGQLGIRFDACGWSTSNSDAHPFVKAAGAIPIMEHVMLNGETVIDGPETIPVECSQETATSRTKDGYTRRNWMWFPHFININVDEFRKILDGTVRIMTRKEVIDRSKICIINDGSTNFHTPEDLYDSLYRQKCDNYGRGLDKPHKRPLEQRWWFKSTGRYAPIPQCHSLLDVDARSIEKKLTWSTYNSIYGYNDATASTATIASRLKKKVNLFNSYFPEEYTGDIFAAHHENCWMTYNPYQYDETYDKDTDTRTVTWATSRATGRIPFLYNTCDSVLLNFAPYSMAVMKEFGDKVTFYMTNYRNKKSGSTFAELDNETDTIVIYGIQGDAEVEFTDRAQHRASTVVSDQSGDTLTLVVKHNGPLDLTVYCQGNATERLTEYTEATIVEPALPPVYTDTLQYEAECFDYKSIANNRTNAYYHGHAGYMGQGFVEMGTSTTAAIRDTIRVLAAGDAKLKLRYQSPDGDAKMRLRLNGTSTSITLPKSADWTEMEVATTLEKGENTLILQNSASGNKNTFIDCVKVYNYATDDETGVQTIAPARYSENALYNLTGQRVSASYKGIVIRNGKKLVKMQR